MTAHHWDLLQLDSTGVNGKSFSSTSGCWEPNTALGQTLAVPSGITGSSSQFSQPVSVWYIIQAFVLYINSKLSSTAVLSWKYTVVLSAAGKEDLPVCQWFLGFYKVLGLCKSFASSVSEVTIRHAHQSSWPLLSFLRSHVVCIYLKKEKKDTWTGAYAFWYAEDILRSACWP